MSGPPRLAIRGLVHRWGPVAALDGVAFAVDPGEVVALLGENGAGKSTLVELLSGGVALQEGTLELDGRPYAPRSPRQARRAGVVAVHQHFQLVEAFTVAENLALAGTGGAGPDREAWRRLEEATGLELPPLHLPVGTLGVGERQRLEIGRALLARPGLLLLDEPTAVLTPAEAGALFCAVRRLAEEGVAVLFITHRLEEVARAAHRVVVLRHGRVVAEGGADTDPAALARAMVGRVPGSPERPLRKRGPVCARLEGVAVPPVLAPLDLALASGEITVLAGVDGNGQVAAARRLAGLERGPGTVVVGGRRLENPSPGELRALGVRVVPGDRTREGVVSGLTVAENLALGRHREPPFTRNGLLDPAGLLREGARLVEAYGIAGAPGQPCSALSGGNQQKVVVARAVAARPRVLVAIHPTRGLDVAARTTVHAHLLAAAARGAALLVVTSDLAEARALGDRILVFSRGRVVGEGGPDTPGELLARWVGGEAA